MKKTSIHFLPRTLKRGGRLVVLATITLIAASVGFSGPKDSGVRQGTPGAGGPISGLSANQLAMFNEGKFRVTELEATCDGCSQAIPGSSTGENPLLAVTTNSAGLGARFNSDQCMSCHSQPAIGGSGGFLVPNPSAPASQQRVPENPMFDLVPHRFGMQNKVPSFVLQYGPIREVRFKKKADGTPDGGVHQLWTVVGRTDDPTIAGCNASILPQPDFETQYSNGNLSFRIPTPTFGMGLVESIQDQEIMNQHNATAAVRAALGVQGTPNRSGNDGTITRFGWKAQNKSIMIFSGEAYNVEMGVTNEAFPQAVEELDACNGPQKNHPNDGTRFGTDDSQNAAFNNPMHIMADWAQFAIFMRFLDAPQPVPFSSSALRGQQLFGTGPSNPGIGCFTCHTPSMSTAAHNDFAVLQSRPVNLYSDLLVHHMGAGLADDITQGLAQGDMFRSSPLWGVGQRMFFLHDGRTSDIYQAILMHQSDGGTSAFGTSYPPSEANAVINNFKQLSNSDQQAVLDFLRSL